MKTLKDTPAEVTIKKFTDVKTVWYKGLKQFPIFGKGWLRRVNEAHDAAMSMVNQ